jgi:PIN domain nuclease of toxin-antitoxin system
MFLDNAASKKKLAISIMSVWETEILDRKGRIQLLPNVESWLEAATTYSGCQIFPMDTELILAQRQLPESFHNDPADRLIVTTALLANIPLATFDEQIIRSGLIKIADLNQSS